MTKHKIILHWSNEDNAFIAEVPEFFPASTDDQWTLIQRVIDDFDYYVVIIGGRYGSTGASGLSYTEKEYDYAVSKGKPLLAFSHANPEDLAKRTDRDRELHAKLAVFRTKAESRMCKYWSNADDLGGKVSRSRSRPEEVRARRPGLFLIQPIRRANYAVRLASDFLLRSTLHALPPAGRSVHGRGSRTL